MTLVLANFEHDSRLRVRSLLIKKLQSNFLKRGLQYHQDLEVSMRFAVIQMVKSAA